MLEQRWKEFVVMGVSSAHHLGWVGASLKMKNIHYEEFMQLVHKLNHFSALALLALKSLGT